MKAPYCILLALCLAASAGAQAPGTQYSPEQLDQLVGPIALYPDPLVALILPASTTPSDVSAAAQYLASGADPSAAGSQPWSASVQGLAHYPAVIKWMNDNLDWTQSLGAAFAMQPSDVMQSIQQDRAKAKAAGSLTDTPQQQVDMEGDDIRIVPTDPNTIYVPQYDPDDVYEVPDGYAGPFITFGLGFPVGPWLGFECNWDNFGIWYGPWHPGWAYRRDWAAGGGWQHWHPDPVAGHALVRNYYRPYGATPTPRVIAGAHSFSRPPGSTTREPAYQAPRSLPDYRGYAVTAPRPSSPAPKGPLFGSYARGTQTREYSTRGKQSRQAPVRSAPAPRQSAPAPGRDRH